MRRPTTLILAILGALLLLALVFVGPLEHFVDARLNRTTQRAAAVPPRASELHRRLWIADLHCDVLLWDRDILARSTRGHVDLPRLRDGHVSLQVFSMPTAYPLFANYHRSPSWPDILGLAAFAHRWPRAAWTSPVARALAQAQLLHEAARESHGGLVVVTDARQLAAHVRDDSAGSVGAILSIEGLHVARNDASSIDHLYATGVRVFGLAHMSDNSVAGSAHGWRKYGLTDFGRRVVARIDSLGGIIDLAHASDATIDDVLATPNLRVMVSHTGVDGTCPGERNLSDDQLSRIAAHGGVIGIGFWRGATCGDDVASIVRAIRHAVDVAGIGAVALGSDFDGAVRTPFDAAGLAQLTEGLLAEGFDAEEIARIMGLNTLEFFLRSLPAD
jgi:membrane dipeptidase